MIRFTFQDGSTLRVTPTAVVTTNLGPMLASEVTVGTFVRCGAVIFSRVDDIAVI
jgi:hypothetical protein